MTQTIVQVNFNFAMPAEQYVQIGEGAAAAIAATEGLVWKIWSVNAARQEACSVYLFSDGKAAQAFVDGPVIASLAEIPGISNLVVRSFEVLEGLTAVTRGPVQTLATAIS